ncbi:N-acetylmuramoyl-L-alanine amidase [Spirosoma soli]|uniref:N-acetylmuramoyl-L-alanine amidase n=1 Tax=Spirosoma soli TaxID=1770529 RepID=A0ABW5LYU1_9BACT
MKACNVQSCRLLMVLLCLSASPVLAQLPSIRDTVLTGYTRTALTPMYYGLGTDRLGGARMETLDSNVVLNVTGIDSTQKFWRVRLAPSLTAFVPVEQVRVDTLQPYPVGSLTGNWTVYGDTAGQALGPSFDYVAVRLPARLPYRSQQQVNPSRLVVDVFGATPNTNWITQLRSVQAIRNVWFEQIADETFRIYIDLVHEQSWGYSIYYQRNTLVIRVRRPPKTYRLRGLTIAVDAGHGGSNTGAKGNQSGRFEKELTFDVAQRLRALLERAGVRVVMTRTNDTLLGPTARIIAMRQALPDMLVSIHFNSSGNAAIRGVSTYYKHIGYRPLSQTVLQELLKTGATEFGNVGHFNFFFNVPTDYPNVLVEGPFLSNSADEALITNERFRQNMAKAIWKGIRKFVKKAR